MLSAVLFAAREGWVDANVPVCERPKCVIQRSTGDSHKKPQEGGVFIWASLKYFEIKTPP